MTCPDVTDAGGGIMTRIPGRPRSDVYLETFIVTWAKHFRQHERVTRGASVPAQLIATNIQGEPIVRVMFHS
jgi:hypothetical protein